MNDTRLLPDDPKLTAYALGELTGDERATVEAALRQNPALRTIVEDIRAASAQLEAALADETANVPISNRPRTTPIVAFPGREARASKPPSRPRRAKLVPGRERVAAEQVDYPFPSPRPKLLRFPQFYYVAAGAAAACFAVFVALRDDPTPTAPRVASTTPAGQVIQLTPPVATTTETTANAEATPATAGTPTVDVRVTATVTPASAAAADASAPQTEQAAAKPGGLIPGSLSLVTQIQGAMANGGGTIVQSEVTLGKSPEGGNTITVQTRLFPDSVTAKIAGVNDAALARDAAASNVTEPIEPAVGGSALAATDVSSSQTSVTTRPTEILTFNATAPTPIVNGPVVASANVGSLVPGSMTLVPRGTGVGLPGSGEVVSLSTFMVAGSRASGFAIVTPGDERAETRRPVVSDRENLPLPPPGVKFGRKPQDFAAARDNDFVNAFDTPNSTFAIDVDTASYANVRRIIEHGWVPEREAVRIEEMLNYFPYRYAAPKGDRPIAASLEVADAPWAPGHRLVRIGLRARDVRAAERPAANLVFLLDVSSSMNQLHKLPLVKQAMHTLVKQLRPDDRVAIVTYAGSSGLALPSTPAARSREILNALDALTPTQPEAGVTSLHLAYDVARANFAPGAINRVILCTDGDFHALSLPEDELLRFVEDRAGAGIPLTVFGFGVGNYPDTLLEKLARRGSGSYAYVDTRREAEKLLVAQLNSTLVTVAKDVKLNVDFNPAKVASYRLIGYENRLLRKEDFSDDTVDAGELGAGHMVTALYEIVPVRPEDKVTVDLSRLIGSKYAPQQAVSSRLEMPDNDRGINHRELLTLTVRYKKPGALFSVPSPIEVALVDRATPFARASADFKFAAAVAQFGMILRGSPHRGGATMGDVIAWAATAASPADDPGGYRGEFIELARKAQTLLR